MRAEALSRWGVGEGIGEADGRKSGRIMAIQSAYTVLACPGRLIGKCGVSPKVDCDYEPCRAKPSKVCAEGRGGQLPKGAPQGVIQDWGSDVLGAFQREQPEAARGRLCKIRRIRIGIGGMDW